MALKSIVYINEGANLIVHVLTLLPFYSSMSLTYSTVEPLLLMLSYL